MVEKALLLFKDIFYHCATWTNSLLDAVGGKGVVLAAFVIVLVIGLLFIPMRGGNLVADWSTFRDFNMSAMHKGKYQGGKKLGTRSTVYKGKFEKGNRSSAIVRKRNHNSN